MSVQDKKVSCVVVVPDKVKAFVVESNERNKAAKKRLLSIQFVQEALVAMALESDGWQEYVSAMADQLPPRKSGWTKQPKK